MRLILFIVLFLYSQLGCCGPQEDRAVRHIQRAIIQYPVVKRTAKKLEKKAYQYIPVSRQTAGYVGGVAMAAVRGGVNTRVFKNIDFDMLGGNCRPDLEYRFDGTVNANINFQWSW